MLTWLNFLTLKLQRYFIQLYGHLKRPYYPKVIRINAELAHVQCWFLSKIGLLFYLFIWKQILDRNGCRLVLHWGDDLFSDIHERNRHEIIIHTIIVVELILSCFLWSILSAIKQKASVRNVYTHSTYKEILKKIKKMDKWMTEYYIWQCFRFFYR